MFSANAFIAESTDERPVWGNSGVRAKNKAGRKPSPLDFTNEI